MPRSLLSLLHALSGSLLTHLLPGNVISLLASLLLVEQILKFSGLIGQTMRVLVKVFHLLPESSVLVTHGLFDDLVVQVAAIGFWGI